MSSWLSKASNVFKREIPDEPQPFTIACGCGAEQSGIREDRFQRIPCAVCGANLFVLPRDVYPAPHPVARQKALEAEPIEVAEIADAEDFSQEQEAPTKQKKRRSGSKATSAQIETNSTDLPTLSELRERIRDASRPRREPQTVASPKERAFWSRGGEALHHGTVNFWRNLITFWSPFRLVSAAVLLVIVFTLGWTVRQSLLAKAVKIAKLECEAGLAAIEEEKWVEAREHLAKAVPALDRLGRVDPEAQTVRQYFRETNAQFRLCSVTLAELLSQAQAEFQAREDKEDAKNNLAMAYHGDWLILEALVRNVTKKDSDTDRFLIQLPLSPGDAIRPVKIEVNWPIFRKIIPPGEERHFILSGAILDCRMADENDGWIIELNPENGFLWTHLNTYLAVGFEFNPLRTQQTVTQELNAQAELMGVPK